MDNTDKSAKSGSAGLNPRLKSQSREAVEPVDIDRLFIVLKKGDRYALSRAITLVESQRYEDQLLASKILDRCLQSPSVSKRIAISGAPGVGKSTFIESFGMYLISKGLKIAVLAVDPSSIVSGGSILADKTRMSALSNQENAYIRPTASATYLGGVARSTKATISLCETAGFDLIFVETVGVGQSEISVSQMVDLLLLIIQPGAGDSIQGIKRGIMELADIIIVNKADGHQLELAKKTRADYTNALGLLRPKTELWHPKISICSALEHTGMAEIWQLILDWYDAVNEKYLQNLRMEQDISWFHHLLTDQLKTYFIRQAAFQKELNHIISELEKKKISINTALEKISHFLHKNKSL